MKLITLAYAALIANSAKSVGRKVVLANGCFDLLHLGHIRHLQAAKRLGDVLMITVTQDAHVHKGPDRPWFSAEERCEALIALECVDYVCINTPKPGEAIRIIRPHIYVKGRDYRNNITPDLAIEKKAIEDEGGQLIFTDEPEMHSTDIIQKLMIISG